MPLFVEYRVYYLEGCVVYFDEAYEILTHQRDFLLHYLLVDLLLLLCHHFYLPLQHPLLLPLFVRPSVPGL